MHKEWSFKFLSTLGVLVHLLLIDIPTDFYKWITQRRKNVRDQLVVITGAGSGLGRRMAELFAAEGAVIAAVDINEAGAAETVRLLEEHGGRGVSYKCDISNEEDMNRVANEIQQKQGSVDIIICNAAVLSFQFFMDLSSNDLKKSFDVNVIGTVNTIRSFLKDMETRNAGQIVAISSVAGFYGETYGLAYCPSKFAVRGVMECLQMELRDMGLDGIKCSTICPYFARTPMVLNAGLRPTCTWFPFMSINSCAQRMVDAILKEKTLMFIPNYTYLLAMFKNLMSVNVAKTLREYLGVKYRPTGEIKTQRKLLPTVPDYFESPQPVWTVVVTVGLIINFLAWTHPSMISICLPFVMPLVLSYPWLLTLTNLGVMVAHLAEAIYALVLCDEARFSLACSFKWFAQTALLGYPSLRILKTAVAKHNKVN